MQAAVQLRRQLREFGAPVNEVAFERHAYRPVKYWPGRGVLHALPVFASAPEPVVIDLADFIRRDDQSDPDADARLTFWAPALEAMTRELRPIVDRMAAAVNTPAGEPRFGGIASAATADQAAYLGRLYDHLNHAAFDGRLPDAPPIRLDGRYRRQFGMCRYGIEDGRRIVLEIALSADLLLPENGQIRRLALIHEMAHLDAWLRYAVYDHSHPWQRIVGAAGGQPSPTTRAPVRLRQPGTRPTTYVPDDVR